MSMQPLFEVFGFPVNSQSEMAKKFRERQLCPFQGSEAKCTKDKKDSPLGVCSIMDGERVAITCPVRFKQADIILKDAAKFFFKPDEKYKVFPEVRIHAEDGGSAGNIDFVLATIGEDSKIKDFASVEIQAVYISGNVRNPFESYMKDEKVYMENNWIGEHYPRPDYLSSSRKRLIPQMVMKGGIFKEWNKKQAIVLHSEFFNTLPRLKEISEESSGSADIVWLIYDLAPMNLNDPDSQLELRLVKKMYTDFSNTLATISTRKSGKIEDFEMALQEKLIIKTGKNKTKQRLTS